MYNFNFVGEITSEWYSDSSSSLWYMSTVTISYLPSSLYVACSEKYIVTRLK